MRDSARPSRRILVDHNVSTCDNRGIGQNSIPTIDLNQLSRKVVLALNDIQDPLGLERVVEGILSTEQLVISDHIWVDGRLVLHMVRPLGPPRVTLVRRTGVSGTGDGHSRRGGEGRTVFLEGVVPHLEVLVLRSVPEEGDVRLVL
jgi:hypothetical protein